MAEQRTTKPGWNIHRFDQIVINVNERVEPGETNLKHYVGLEHLDGDSLKIQRWSSPSDVIGQKLGFRKGDIIFGKRRVYQRKLAVADFDGICSAHAMVLRPRIDVILPEFLPFFMQSDLFMNRALEISVGSLSPTINWKTLARQEFALPPLAEQRRIADLLHAADSTVRVYASSLNAAVALRASIRMSEFDPHHRPPSTLKELCGDGRGIQIGPFGAQLHQSDYVETGVPVVMPANMIEDEIDLESTAKISEEKANELAVHRVKPGDILLPRRGELDRRAYVEKQHEGLLCGTGSIRIRVDESVSSRAIFHALSSAHSVQWLVGNAVGTTMPNLNTKIVGRIPIALPSRSRQEIVVEQLDNLETQIDRIKQRQNDAMQLKAAILASTVGG